MTMNMFPQLCSVTLYPNTVCAAVLARQSQGTEQPSYSCTLKENFVVHFAALLWAREGETVVLEGSKSPSCPQSLNYLCCNGRMGESLLPQAARLKHMQTSNVCMDKHSDEKASTQSSHVSDRDIQNPENKGPSAHTTLWLGTHSFLTFQSWEKAFLHFSEDMICLANCDLVLQCKTKISTALSDNKRHNYLDGSADHILTAYQKCLYQVKHTTD